LQVGGGTQAHRKSEFIPAIDQNDVWSITDAVANAAAKTKNKYDQSVLYIDLRI